MNCRQVQEYLDDLLCAAPDQAAEPALAEHAARCPRCQREHAAAMRALALLQPSGKTETPNNLKERIMTRVTAAEHMESSKAGSVDQSAKWWKPAFALGLAATFVIMVAAFILVKPSTPVYALEQTLEANRGLRSIHMRMTPPTFGSVGEIWAQFDENGDLQHLRMNFPDTEDGPKDVVWENGKATVWFKKKGSVVVVREEKLVERLKLSYDAWDPKFIVEELCQKRADGAANIEVEESATGAPITITINSEREPGRQDVLTVDPDTKLLRQREVYRLQDGDYRLVQSTEYLEYNEPVDPAVFILEAPAEAVRVDQTTQEVGLAQGNLSDKEIAVKVVREFFSALIAKDYAKAGQLLEGMPADKTKELLGPLNVVRIVSIGEPTPYERNQSLRVPCKVEVQSGGQTHVWEPYGPFVRQVYQQPQRWTICGGI